MFNDQIGNKTITKAYTRIEKYGRLKKYNHLKVKMDWDDIELNVKSIYYYLVTDLINDEFDTIEDYL